MRKKYFTRRKLLNYAGLFILFLLGSCRKISKEVKIVLQSSLYPDFFKDTIPNFWQKENINLGEIHYEKNRSVIQNSDFMLITDGWVNTININEFEKLNEISFFENLDERAKNFLNSFDEKQREKLFPVGIVPYAVIIKNNKDLIDNASKSWDFLLSEKLTRKIILPRSPRVVISIAKKIKGLNSLSRLKKQAILFDDQNSLNWLINSDACVAIIPYSFCLKYLKIDSRLSIVFPNQGVPLMWHFILSRSNNNNEILFSWIKSLENKSNLDKLASQGWYLPFKNDYSKREYNINGFRAIGPSQICWENSWSFPSLTKLEKLNLENSWNESLTP